MNRVLAVCVLLPTIMLAAGAADNATQIATLSADKKNSPPVAIGTQHQLFPDFQGGRNP
jgi:hypothetical protein